MRDLFPESEAKVAEWSSMPEVLGVIMTGSKSLGHEDELSDDDLEVFFTEEAFAGIAPARCHEYLVEGEGASARVVYDALYTTISEFKQKIDSPRDLDHWPYESARVIFDRTGEVHEAVDRAARMDPDFRRARLLHATVDAWAAQRRAAKTRRRGGDMAVRLVLARGVKALSRVLFALEWRWVPLDHWLEAELSTLEDPSGAGRLLIEALALNRPEPLAEALDRLEDPLYDEGVARPSGRIALFLELIHPSRVRERREHGLY
ncbi:MAG TPA: DUF4037 domain-containing protein [Blastocatellia bacterium]|nr:DUF4037 domain-containing protein [Blastocatellia bacterium]